MKRRNTVDFAYGAWPLCQYYFTHNNGSSDDILIHKRPKSTFFTYENKSHYNSKKFCTFPPFLHTSLKHKRSLSYLTEQPASFYHTKLTLHRPQRRQTLAHILDALAPTIAVRPSDDLPFHNPNTDDDLIIEQDSIYYNANNSHYCPQLDLQKIENHQVPHTPAGQNDEVILAMPIHSTVYPLSPTTANTANTSSSSLIDVYLFIFGFILFPLWWYGTWRYFTCSAHVRKHMSTMQFSFQIFNVCLSLVSLLLIGFIVGLVTVWIH